jgi:hypothetical protein
VRFTELPLSPPRVLERLAETVDLVAQPA